MNACDSASWSFRKNKRMAIMFNTAQVHGDLIHQEFLDNAIKAQETFNENKFWWMKKL